MFMESLFRNRKRHRIYPMIHTLSNRQKFEILNAIDEPQVM